MELWTIVSSAFGLSRRGAVLARNPGAAVEGRLDARLDAPEGAMERLAWGKTETPFRAKAGGSERIR